MSVKVRPISSGGGGGYPPAPAPPTQDGQTPQYDAGTNTVVWRKDLQWLESLTFYGAYDVIFGGSLFRAPPDWGAIISAYDSSGLGVIDFISTSGLGGDLVYFGGNAAGANLPQRITYQAATEQRMDVNGTPTATFTETLVSVATDLEVGQAAAKATTGAVRLGNNEQIVALSQDTTTDIPLLGLNANDEIELGGKPLLPIFGSMYRQNVATTYAMDGTAKTIGNYTGTGNPCENVTPDTGAAGTLVVDNVANADGLYDVGVSGFTLHTGGSTIQYDIWLEESGAELNGSRRRYKVQATGGTGTPTPFAIPISRALTAASAIRARIQSDAAYGVNITIPYGEIHITRNSDT